MDVRAFPQVCQDFVVVVIVDDFNGVADVPVTAVSVVVTAAAIVRVVPEAIIVAVAVETRVVVCEDAPVASVVVAIDIFVVVAVVVPSDVVN